MKQVFLAWQDPESRCWFPIGQLTFDGNHYEFVYIAGAKEAREKTGFTSLSSFPILEEVYRSAELFPLFSNRLMRPSRPDYQKYIEYLKLSEEERDPISILSRSGGQKATDNLKIFAIPELDSKNFYHIYFFTHGLRYYPESLERVASLQEHDPLDLVPEPTNQSDSQAIYISTRDEYTVGYCPRYLAADIHKFLDWDPIAVTVFVEQVNPVPAPIQSRLLCHLIAPRLDDNYQPFSTAEYQPINTPIPTTSTI